MIHRSIGLTTSPCSLLGYAVQRLSDPRLSWRRAAGQPQPGGRAPDRRGRDGRRAGADGHRPGPGHALAEPPRGDARAYHGPHERWVLTCRTESPGRTMRQLTGTGTTGTGRPLAPTRAGWEPLSG